MNLLKKYKKIHNLTDDQLANRIGISKSGLRKVIRDKSAFVTIETVIKIYNATGLSPYDYLKDLPRLQRSARKIRFLAKNENWPSYHKGLIRSIHANA